MSNEKEQLRILKNLIMSDTYISQTDLQAIVKAMDKINYETRPATRGEVETR